MNKILQAKAAQYEAMINGIYKEIEDLYKKMAHKQMDVKTTTRYFETILPVTLDAQGLTTHQRQQNARHIATAKALLQHLETAKPSSSKAYTTPSGVLTTPSPSTRTTRQTNKKAPAAS